MPVNQADAVVEVHQHGVEYGESPVLRVSIGPAPAFEPLLLCAKPVDAELGQARLIHPEHKLHRKFRGAASNSAIGGRSEPVFRTNGKQLTERGKSLLICGDTGNGPQLAVRVHVKTLLELTVRFRINPVVFHLFKRSSSQKLLMQRQELMVVGDKAKAGLHGLESALLIAEITAQLRGLQPNPRVVRFLPHSLFRAIIRFLQPSAVHQSHGKTVIPCAAALCLWFG